MELQDRVRAAQIRLLYANNGAPMATTLLVSASLAFILVREGALAPAFAMAWVAAILVHTTTRWLVRAAYLRANPPDDQWRVWARRFVIGASVGAVTWAVAIPWFLAPGRFDLQMLVLTVLIAVVYGTVSAFGSYLPAFYPFFVPVIPAIVWFAWQRDTLHVVCAAMLAAWTPTVASLARRYNASLTEALTLRFRNADLVEDLTAQKTLAERANVSKSRFLASASHDLRQPIHALGMFIGALRSHRLPKRSVELVDQMDVSIGALDGLFGSLLDISRLDAGVIESRVRPTPVQPLLARICRELMGEAGAKGVRLILVPSSVAVQSDSVLLERVMRNLIGNAVRYTEDGRVLVGCRRRGGVVSLEVHDTGPGIPEVLREAVFEEFFQVGNPDRDRSKGLGLGLPIVRRLTAILGHPLDMQSTPGRGTSFRVIAPRTTAEAAEAVAATPLATPTGGLVLAIDDEQAIRAGMTALLESWGYRVVAAAGGDEAVALLADGAPPDLIVCDYRLRAGESGLAAIRQVQAAVGEDIPAILVTGDTAPDNIREALASGYPLLHKPLSHGRLRAAVTSLMRRRSPAAAE